MHLDAMKTLLTRTENQLRRAWTAMVNHLREENSVEAIERRQYTDPAYVLSGLEDAAARFAAAEHAAYIHAGQAAAKWLNGEIRKSTPFRPDAFWSTRVALVVEVAKKLPVFDPIDPPALRWAETNRLELIREITGETRDMIRAAMIEAARTGANPREWARGIRDSIGLTEYQHGLVANYRRELERGQYAAAMSRELSNGHSDRAIANAIRNEVSLTVAQIDTAVERYRANWQAFRAETIARTEGLRVAHQGSEELYRQAVSRGDIDAEQIERTWNHSPRRSTAARRGRGAGKGGKSGPRAFHVVMHGQKRGFGELFESGLGGELRYPGDPEASAEETANCACALSTRILPGARGAGAQGPSGGSGGAAEDVAVLDEEALAAEEAAAEEEAAAAQAEAEQAMAAEDTGLSEADIEEQHRLIDEQIAALEAERHRLPGRL